MKKFDTSKIEMFVILCIIAVLMIIMFLCGCTSVSYDRSTGRVSYNRIGGVEFRKLEVVRDGDDVLLNIEQYKTEPLAEVAGSVAEGVARGLKQ